MKRIQESIIILSLLDEDLRNREEAIILHKLHFAQFQANIQAEHHYMSLFNMSLINIKSYLDEYDNYFGSEYDEKIDFERVKKVKKCLEPLVSYLRKWKGINDFRNNYLAHAMRDSKTKNLILLEKSFEQYHIPNDFAELYLLTNIIHVITMVIKEIFEKEMKHGAEIFKKYSDSMSNTMSRPLVSINDAAIIIKNLVAEMNKKLNHEFNFNLEEQGFDQLWDRLNFQM